MLTSSQIVNAYANGPAAAAATAMGLRGGEPAARRARVRPGPRARRSEPEATDEDLGLANVILPNGSRLYVDHAHPEYSSPECTNPRDVVVWDKAGERIMAEAAAAQRLALSAADQPVQEQHRQQGRSHGTHENHLMREHSIRRHRSPPHAVLRLAPSRDRSGRVGLGQDGRSHGFQISQRADYFEVEVGLETTLKRPIINTRDEPHADPEKYRRLHVIIGDANLSEVSTYLKVGTAPCWQ